MTKSELRSIYVGKRRALSTEEHAENSARISNRFFSQSILTSVRKVHCFISMPHVLEVDTSPIFRRLWLDFPEIETFVPRVDDQTGKIESVAYSVATSLTQSRWKIEEPSGPDVVDANVLDLVIVPLLCFDVRGQRVGYGKGFYDRFLSECRPDCVRAGLSFFPPIERIDDTHEDDVPLDLCITPDETYQF
jgi:5-formyltetrahydrofolate cyclo-ligase